MYLQQLIISNYKSFYEPKTFEFKPGFNVLIGSNSSGKTSVLEAIAFNDLPNTPHRSILNVIDIDTVLTDATSVDLSFDTSFKTLSKLILPQQELYIGNGSGDGNFFIHDTQIALNRIEQEQIAFDIRMDHISGRASRLYFKNWASTWRPNQTSTHFPGIQINLSNLKNLQISNFGAGSADIDQLLSRVVSKTYKFSAERSVAPIYGHHLNGELLPNSSNLAYCINQLQSNNKDLFEQLNRLVNRIFPTIHWISAPPNGNNQFELKIHTNPPHLNRGDLSIPINRVGTGVGNAVAMLYVVLTAASSERYILLEEPNSFLHPRALRELLSILAEIGSKHQYFITTHSSDVLRTIQASTVTLLEYDGKQTTIQQTASDKLHQFKTGLIDLGIRLTDLHGCDRVLWVEGETEEAIFPLILQKFFPEIAQGIAVLRLHSTGDFESRKINPEKVAEIYKKLSESSFLAPPMIAITLDQEAKSASQIEKIERECKGIVHFLPKPMIEDYLLDNAAIAAILTIETGKSVTEKDVAQQIEQIILKSCCKLFPKNPENNALHAAQALTFIFNALHQGLEYRKANHGLKIAEWIIQNKSMQFQPLQDWFKPILNQ